MITKFSPDHEPMFRERTCTLTSRVRLWYI